MIAFFVKTTLILVIVSITTALMRRSSAASRHVVWTCGLLAVLFLPVASAVLPALPLPLLRPTIAETVLSANTSLPEMQVFEAQPAPAFPDPSPSARGINRGAAVTPTKAAGSWPWIELTWLVGALLVLSRLVVGFWRRGALARRCAQLSESPLLEAVRAHRRTLGISRHVRVLIAPREMMPATWGFLRPTILLPPSAHQWTADRITLVAVHELSHVLRFDTVTAAIAFLSTALVWWNPLVWFAAKRAQLERERACDDAVLRSGLAPSRYAEELLEIARTLPSPFAQRLSLAMAKPHGIERRIDAILDTQQRRSVTSRTAILAAGVLLAAQWPLAAAVLVPATATPSSPTLGAATDVPRSSPVSTQAADVPSQTVAPSQPKTPLAGDIAQTANAPAPVSGLLFGPSRTGNLFHNDLNERLALATPRLLTRHLPFRRKESPQSGAEPVTAGQFGAGASRPGNGVENPVRIREVKPVYPPAAERSGLQGTVELEAVVGPEGTVTDVRVMRSSDTFGPLKPGFDNSAIDAVRQNRFVPCKHNGQPVTCLVVFELQFTPPPLAPIPTGQFGAGAYKFREKAEMEEPVRLKNVSAQYTPAALRERIEGTVELEFIIQADGTVGDVRVTKSLDTTFGLDEQAIKTIKVTPFKPGTLNGVAVPILATVAMQFTLR